MKPYSKDYIIPGDVMADETVLCIRCGTVIMRLSYKEMAKVNSLTETVNVPFKMRLGNHRQMGVVMYRMGHESMTYLPVCQDCLKEVVPERDSDKIIRQIVRACQIEARWIAMPQEVIDGIAQHYADARILRALTPEELTAGKILEVVT